MSNKHYTKSNILGKFKAAIQTYLKPTNIFETYFKEVHAIHISEDIIEHPSMQIMVDTTIQCALLHQQ